jgi:actin-related protein 8
MEEQADMQTQLQNVTTKAAHIEKMLGRGQNTVVLQLGSHSLKYGLANDSNPQWLRCLVARKIQVPEEQTKACLVQLDAEQAGESTRVVEGFLTKKGNIKRGEVGVNKMIKGKPAQKIEPTRERFEFLPKPNDCSKDAYLGEEVFYLEGRKDFKIREPIQYGLLNINENYSEQEVLNDLELLIRKAMDNLGIDRNEIEKYSVVICAPDKFHRGQFKLVIDMLMEKIGFAAFALHLESILASFGCGLPLACIVDIGHTTVTVTTVEEGVIVPNSQIKKHFGARDIDVLLLTMLSQRDLLSLIPDGSEVSIHKFKHLAAIEKVREKFGVFLLQEEPNKIADFFLPAELNEPTKICIPFNFCFVVAPGLLFHSECLNLLSKAECYAGKPNFNRSSNYFEQYVDEDDFHDETEMRVNRMMAQCLQDQDQSKKKQILEQSQIDMSSIQQEWIFTNLEDMISYSIFQLKDGETRKKAANSIVITGGFARTPFFVEELEDRLIERIAKFDPNIDRVEVVDHSGREFDNAELTWVGASIVPKLDCMRDGFVTRNRWLGRVDPEEERERRFKKDCSEFGIKYLKEKIAFQW